MATKETSVLVLLFVLSAFYNGFNCFLIIEEPYMLKGTYKAVGHAIGSVEEKWPGTNITIVRRDSSDVSGKGVIIDSDINDYENDAFELQERGAVLVLYSVNRDRTNLGIVSYRLRHPQKDARMNIPIVTIAEEDIHPGLINDSQQLSGFIFPDSNSFHKATSHWAFHTTMLVLIIYTLTSFAVSAVILWKRVLSPHFRTDILTIPIVCLVFEVVANLLRMVLLIDPFQGHRIYPYTVQQILIAISLPFSLGSALLVSLYWHEAIVNKEVKVTYFISKTRKVFICIIVALFIFYVASAISRTFESNNVAEYMSILRWTATILSLAIIVVYSIIVSRSLFVHIKRMTVESQRLLKMRARLIAFSTLQVLLLIDFFFNFAIDFKAADGYWYAILFTTYILILDSLSIVQSVPFWITKSKGSKRTPSSALDTPNVKLSSTVQVTL